MKCILIIIVTISLFAACKETAGKTVLPVAHKDTLTKAAALAVKKDFSKIIFASKKDLSCGMPLTAGLEDSVHYKGKIYGFCSAECKADFIKNAAAYVK
jgi:YHS domain-containing protein